MSRDWSQPLTEPLPAPSTPEEWEACLADPWWRICSGVLYKIMVKGDDQDDTEIGQLEPFLPNVNQLRFLHRFHYRNTILKARQLGFTTFAAIWGLDRALWTPNQRCGIIAQDQDTASAILKDKVLLAYENMPQHITDAMGFKNRTAKELHFAHNNSSMRVATSMRGGTIHFLHVSELGKISATYPAKAKEVQTGSLPAVPAAGIATIESTAEGAEGLFFDMTSRAEALAISNTPLNQGDYKFHFFPWFLEPGYRADPARVRISLKQHEYFDKIEAETGHSLDMWQRAWYVTKLEADFSGDTHLMQQEMPSTPAEAWSRSTAGTFLTPQITAARAAGRIGKVPHVASLPVHTFWDIGGSDGTGIWLGQQVGLAMHMLRYIEDWSKGYAHFINAIESHGYVLGEHYLPHDAAAERQGKDGLYSPLSMLQDLRPRWRFNIVPRIHDFNAGITVLRERFNELWIDAEGCKEGITHLELYRKRFNTSTKTFADEPQKHDGHSEAPDALRQWAQGFTPSHATGERKKPARRRSGLTA
ncbi:MAG: hypothetical protein MEQ74_11940 [Paracoccus sp.]|nr:hypothetical protein [Paracoccus sp. (in: a-proteobacteria)]